MKLAADVSIIIADVVVFAIVIASHIVNVRSVECKEPLHPRTDRFDQLFTIVNYNRKTQFDNY